MTIENLKQIAIKYATTKGSRVPLAPDELFNAVVQYFNEFLKITEDINTIQVAVTEEGGNIVFTITGNTLDGKAFTPIVITVDHNDFVTDKEFEAFKTNILDTIESLNNSIAEINSTLDNKPDKIKNPASNYVVYANVNGIDTNVTYTEGAIENTLVYRRADGGGFDVSKGISGKNAANMENIADVEAKIPDVSEFAKKNESNKWTDVNLFKPTPNGDSSLQVVDNTAIPLRIGKNGFYISSDSTLLFPNFIGKTLTIATTNNIPKYTSVDSVIYDTTNGAIIAYNGANEIHIPLLAGENVTIDASEDNQKIVISAAGGGGTGDVTAAGNNTFTGENTFTNEITFNTMKSEAGGIQFGNFEGITEDGYNYSGLNDYQFIMQKFVGTDDYYETVIGADLITYKPAGNNNVNEFHFPNKSGTFAMTTDIIKDPIYFISFYANELSEPCHLIGTMMSKNSYGTGQKTYDNLAVMLADNFYTNCNEGLAVYGKIAGKDILCIYSEDGLSIRYLDEDNSDLELSRVMFFAVETEL